MANKYPLQAGDVAPDLSDYNFSNEADRRSQKADELHPSGDMGHANGRLFKVGQAYPIDSHSAPFTTISMDGDNNGQPTETYEIDIRSYGDAYDPTAPLKVNIVAKDKHWDLDSDGDGQLN